MKKILNGFIAFLKSKGFRCFLITFLICAFLGIWTGFVVTLIMMLCDLFYTKMFDLYKVIGFLVGWGLVVFQRWII